MGKLKIHTVAQPEGGRIVLFRCPGCGYDHPFKIDTPQENGAMWTWDGNFDRPTFDPSLLCNKGSEIQCHLHVIDGKIIYASDCYHDLAGKTVDLPDIYF